MQQNQTNAVNDNNNNEMDQLSRPPPTEDPPDQGEEGMEVAIVVEFRSGLNTECRTLSSTR